MRHFNHFNHSFENAVFVETDTGDTVAEPVWRYRDFLRLQVIHLRLQPYLNDWIKEMGGKPGDETL
jgi:hypothetical protein